MDQLDRMLERWQRMGILTPAQAEEIRAAESSARDERRIPLVAEVLGYLGAAFVLSAAAALTAQYWSELEAVARGAVLLAVTALLVLAGWSVARSEEPAFRRLAGLLWFAAVGGAGLFADVVATDALDLGAGFSLPTGAIMSGLGLALWRLHPSALQLVSVFAGVVLLTAGISDLLGGDDAFGPLLWGVGVASLLLARRRIISPERTAYAIACAAILLGAQWAVEPFGDTRGWALALGFSSGIALLALSVAWRGPILLGLGTAGVFLFLPQLVEEYLGSTIGSTSVLLVAGLALLGVAIVAVRLRDKVSR